MILIHEDVMKVINLLKEKEQDLDKVEFYEQRAFGRDYAWVDRVLSALPTYKPTETYIAVLKALGYEFIDRDKAMEYVYDMQGEMEVDD